MIGRIFYVVDRNWNGRISAAEIRRSNLLNVITQLEEETDINQVGGGGIMGGEMYMYKLVQWTLSLIRPLLGPDRQSVPMLHFRV